jgi:hypothetical protein
MRADHILSACNLTAVEGTAVEGTAVEGTALEGTAVERTAVEQWHLTESNLYWRLCYESHGYSRLRRWQSFSSRIEMLAGG